MTDNNDLPDFWGLYWETERFLSSLPQTNNNLDIYDQIYREQEEETLAEFYGYNEYDMDDLNNLDVLDEYDYYEEVITEDNHTECSDESDDDGFSTV